MVSEVKEHFFFRQIFGHNCLGLSMSAAGLFLFSLIVADYVVNKHNTSDENPKQQTWTSSSTCLADYPSRMGSVSFVNKINYLIWTFGSSSESYFKCNFYYYLFLMNKDDLSSKNLHMDLS